MRAITADQPINIERVPIRRKGSSRGITDTMKKLRVGESFLLPPGSIRQSAYKARDRAKIQIVVRQEGDRFRAWRVA